MSRAGWQVLLLFALVLVFSAVKMLSPEEETDLADNVVMRWLLPSYSSPLRASAFTVPAPALPRGKGRCAAPFLPPPARLT